MNMAFLTDHPECLATLAEWYLREWPELFDAAHTPFDEMDAASARGSLDCTLLGFENGRLAASAALLREDVLPLSECSPWLGSVVVDPALRGRGLGREIVILAMAEARRQGIATLHLWTPHHRAFYEKLGWRFVRGYPFKNRIVFILGISLAENPVNPANPVNPV